MAYNGELFVGPRDDPDRYQLWRRIGSGGEGEVWQGTRQLKDGSIGVAVKYYHEARFGVTESLDDLSARLETQAARLRTLHTPGLAAVHESFLGSEPHDASEAQATQIAAYFVMDYIDGVPLPEWASTQPSLFRRLGVLDDAAAALDALHRAGQVHADIKPSNVLVHTIEIPDGSQVPIAVLVDFGVMRAISVAPPSKLIGTPGFIAPELHTGGAYTPASDLYAFAMVCAGLVCDGETSSDIAQAARAAGLPEEGVAVLVAGIAQEPGHRNGELEHGVAGWLSRLRSGLTTTFSTPVTSTLLAPETPGTSQGGRAAEIATPATDQTTTRPSEEPQEASHIASDVPQGTGFTRTTASRPATPAPSPTANDRGRSRLWLIGIVFAFGITSALVGLVLRPLIGDGVAQPTTATGSVQSEESTATTGSVQSEESTATTGSVQSEESATQVEEVQCPDGSRAPSQSQCPPEVQCPDGSTAPSQSQCPPEVQCQDGSTAPSQSQCPPEVQCADGSTAPSQSQCPQVPTEIAVELGEWFVGVPTSLASGEVVFDIVNSGENPHALAIARGRSYDDLPQLDNGAVDTDFLGADFIGSTSTVNPGARGSGKFPLGPGEYVFFCPIEFGPNSHAATGQVQSVTVG